MEATFGRALREILLEFPPGALEGNELIFTHALRPVSRFTVRKDNQGNLRFPLQSLIWSLEAHWLHVRGGGGQSGMIWRSRAKCSSWDESMNTSPPETPAVTAEVVLETVAVPLLQTFETYRPRPAALLHGGLLAILSILAAVVVIGKSSAVARPSFFGVHFPRPSPLPIERNPAPASDLNTIGKLGPEAFEAWLKLARRYFVSMPVLRGLDADHDFTLSPWGGQHLSPPAMLNALYSVSPPTRASACFAALSAWKSPLRTPGVMEASHDTHEDTQAPQGGGELRNLDDMWFSGSYPGRGQRFPVPGTPAKVTKLE